MNLFFKFGTALFFCLPFFGSRGFFNRGCCRTTMSSKRKKIRVEEVDADLDHDYVKNQIKFEASTCIDCTNYKEWLVCEVCLGPKNPVGPVVLLPPKESREEKKKRMKKYFQDRTKKKHLKKTKKEIKQGKQSTLASFLGLKKVCCHRRRRLLLLSSHEKELDTSRQNHAQGQPEGC